MQHTKYNAFGYVVVNTVLSQGELINDKNHEQVDNTLIVKRPYNPNITKENYAPNSINHIWLAVEGVIRYTNMYSGDEILWDEGYCSLDNPMPVGMWVSEVEQNSSVFCLSPGINTEKDPIMPSVSTFKMNTGNTTTIVESTNLFLCKGELSVNGVAVVGPKQVVISSGKTITATSNSYGFIFN